MIREVKGKSPRVVSSDEELEAADALAGQVLTGIASRTGTSTEVADAADIRRRAFTLLLDTYNDARRAVAYLRYKEGDADSIAPSLYAGRAQGQTRPSTGGDLVLQPEETSGVEDALTEEPVESDDAPATDSGADVPPDTDTSTTG